MNPTLAILDDPAFTPLPEFTAEDLARLIPRDHKRIKRTALPALSRRQFDILALPYVRGDFSEAELAGLLAFHEAGGSLLFLGDLPHAGNWYPLRNMHAYRFHLTRCYDDVQLDLNTAGGLTGKGREILGDFPALEQFRDKTLPGLRVTAFPPDITHPIFRISSWSHTNVSHSVVAIERRCRRFFGAKLAVVGFMGGEPRENAAGVYQLPWKHNPGLLTRNWPGASQLALGLLRWLKPAQSQAPAPLSFPLPQSAKPVFGFSTYWAFNNATIPPEFEFFVTEMTARGCQYIRANIPWEDVEPAPGQYDWRATDRLLDLANRERFSVQFWMFPTTRGSGLADAGVPMWALKEPALDRFGNRGFFPSLWSPFYRQHYFGMLETFTKRYATAPALDRFVLDFGNSDFPYGYFYYGGDNTIFDHSKHERAAFAGYLSRELGWTLPVVGKLFGKTFASFDEVPVPVSEQTEAFRVYLDFRTWSIRQGIEAAHTIVRKNAPTKLPPDLPGHGLGSIADLGTYICSAKARHWREEKTFPARWVAMHNAAPTWGGEPWQVGGTYRQYDDALFQSVRLGADYFTIPGADLGLAGDDIARIGYIRRTLAGATRPAPELAVLDRTGWNDFHSLAQVAARMDVPVDLLNAKCRYDFSCYRLLTLPACEFLDRSVTGGGGSSLLPDDEEWYWLLKLAVEKGLRLLISPGTTAQRTILRHVFGITDVTYSAPQVQRVVFPESFGGGELAGAVCHVNAAGNVLLRAADGGAVLVEQPAGNGALLLAGYDDAFVAGEMDCEKISHLRGHPLHRLCQHLGIVPTQLRTDGLFAFKEVVQKDGQEFLLLFSHYRRPVTSSIQFRFARRYTAAMDLATDQVFPLTPAADGWSNLTVQLNPRQGVYLAMKE